MLAEAIIAVGIRPDETASQSSKKNYAQLLSGKLADAIAQDLRARGLKGCYPDRPNGTEREFAGGIGAKKVDVSWVTGRGLGKSPASRFCKASPRRGEPPAACAELVDFCAPYWPSGHFVTDSPKWPLQLYLMTSFRCVLLPPRGRWALRFDPPTTHRDNQCNIIAPTTGANVAKTA